jgi:hypothetical protein
MSQSNNMDNIDNMDSEKLSEVNLDEIKLDDVIIDEINLNLDQSNMDEQFTREFNEELSKSYDPNNETDDEFGVLIKMKRLTETYVTLFSKNVESSPATEAIITQCLVFLLKIKSRIKQVCEHTIVEDDIDVGIDKCMHIIYCSRCETMFEHIDLQDNNYDDNYSDNDDNNSGDYHYNSNNDDHDYSDDNKI